MKPLPLSAPHGTRVLVVSDDGAIVRTKTRSYPWRVGPHDIVLLDAFINARDIERVFLDEPATGTWAWACERVPQVDIRRAEFANGRFVSLVSGKMCWDDGSDFVPHHDDLNATDWETVT